MDEKSALYQEIFFSREKGRKDWAKGWVEEFGYSPTPPPTSTTVPLANEAQG